MGAGWSEDEASEEPKHSQEREENAINVKTELPYNYELIIREADSPVDTCSTHQLYDQLRNGIFLTHKKKKYWIDNKSNTNCFFLYARDISITWAEDNRFWHWLQLCETTHVLVDIVELLNVCWLEIHGKFETTKLSPDVLYEVAFVVMLKDPAYGWEVPVNLRLTYPSGSMQLHKENLLTKPRSQWIEIPAGEFISSPENVGEMEISMYEYEGGKWKKGLIVKGITIRPKI